MPDMCRAALAKMGRRLSFDTMNRTRALSSNLTRWFLLAVAGILFTTSSLLAQPVQHLTITQPGGMPREPVMEGIQHLTNGVRFTWAGPSGYYQVFQKVKPDGPVRSHWARPLISPATPSSPNFIATPSSGIRTSAGDIWGPACGCHDTIRNPELKTPHTGAFTNASFLLPAARP